MEIRFTLTTVFVVFVILKLLDIIHWSWWYVTAPLWLPIALIIGVIFIYAVYKATAMSIERYKRGKV